MDSSTKISGNCVNALPAPPPPRRWLDQLSDRIQFQHYSIRTEQAYSDWVRRFMLFHSKRHPREMSAHEVEASLTRLAVAGRVSASTPNQAKSARLYLSTRRCWRPSCRGWMALNRRRLRSACQSFSRRKKSGAFWR